jgi:tetratricopeptide (TPR) repeat protein
VSRLEVFLVLSLASAGCAGTVAVEQRPRDARAEALGEFEAAVRLARLGPESWPSALERLESARQLDPSLWQAWYDTGWLLEAQEKRAEAIEAYRKALALDGKSEAARRALASALVADGKLDEAAKVEREGLPEGDGADTGTARPAERARRIDLARVLLRAGRLEEAIGELRRVLRAEPRSAAALSALGLVYRAEKRPELAELVLRRALEIEPGRAAAWNDLGLILLALRRDQEAFAAFDKAASLDPSLAEARRNRAAVYLDCGDYEAAAKELAQLTAAQPRLVDGWVALGVAERGRGRFAEARRAYEQALALAPSSAAALYNLGVLLMDFQKDPAAARDAFRRFLEAINTTADGKHEKRADVEGRMRELDRAKPAAPTGGG